MIRVISIIYIPLSLFLIFSVILIAFSFTNIATQSHAQSNCPLKLLGDANCDSLINLIDFEIWRREYTGTSSTSNADFSLDASVNLIDFEIWRRSFVSPQPTSTSNSPTPQLPAKSPTPTTKPSLTPTPIPGSGQLIYSSGFETGAVQCSSCNPDGWNVRIDNGPPSAVQVLSQTSLPIPLREGNFAARVHAERTSSQTTTRAELEGYNLPFFNLKTEYWVGWSIYLPNDSNYLFDNAQNEILTQFRHQDDSSCAASGVSPPNSLRPLAGRWRWDVRGSGGCDSNTSQLTDMGPQIRGKWTDFVARFYFSPDSDGIVQVWVDGNLTVNRINQANYYRNSQGPYLKIGFYKSSWSSASDVTVRTIYYDAVKVYQGSSGASFVAPR